MPEKAFSLEPGGPERLQVSWRGGFKDLTLAFDGQVVASFDEPKQLKAPQAVTLPDGSRLEVQVATTLFPELHLVRDGEPIPGSAGDPGTRHAAAWGMVAVIAGLNVALGLLVELFDIGSLRAIGVGWGSVVSGLVYGVLAFFVRRRSLVALALAIGLFVLDGAFMLVAAARAGGSPPVGGLVARIFFLIPMLRGLGAIRELRRPRRPLRRSPARHPPAPSAGTAPTGVGTSRPKAAVASAPARTLTGAAEKQRLQLSAATPSGAAVMTARGSISMKGKAAVDDAASALRFVAHRCEIGEAGLRVTLPNGKLRDVPWTGIGRVVVRTLPPDPPWDSGLILDLIASAEGGWEPVRIFGPTIVNYGAIASGPAGSRLENVRRLARHVRERNPAVALDEATLAFVEATAPPARFVDMTQFTEYDAAYS